MFIFTEKMVVHVNIICPTERIKRLVRGADNGRIKQILEIVTSDLVRLYKYTVALTLNVISKETLD